MNRRGRKPEVINAVTMTKKRMEKAEGSGGSLSNEWTLDGHLKGSFSSPLSMASYVYFLAGDDRYQRLYPLPATIELFCGFCHAADGSAWGPCRVQKGNGSQMPALDLQELISWCAHQHHSRLNSLLLSNHTQRQWRVFHPGNRSHCSTKGMMWHSNEGSLSGALRINGPFSSKTPLKEH